MDKQQFYDLFSLGISFVVDITNSDATVDIEQTAFGESIRDEIIFKRLHHFRRGIILGSNTQSSDDRALLRDLFLRMPLHDCLLMMVPELWVYYFDNGEVFSTHAPAETLAMLDDNVSLYNIFYESFYERKIDPIVECKISVLLQQTTLIVCLYVQVLELKILLMTFFEIIVSIAYRNLRGTAFLHPWHMHLMREIQWQED